MAAVQGWDTFVVLINDVPCLGRVFMPTKELTRIYKGPTFGKMGFKFVCRFQGTVIIEKILNTVAVKKQVY